MHAALAGLKNVTGPLTVITGGVDKGLDLDPLVAFLAEKAEHVVVIGELRERLCSELQRTDIGSLATADTLEAAVEMVRSNAGTVVLSPASSSFDMFKSYAHRGEVFQAAVKSLR